MTADMSASCNQNPGNIIEYNTSSIGFIYLACSNMLYDGMALISMLTYLLIFASSIAYCICQMKGPDS